MGNNQIYGLLPTRVLSRPWLVQIRLNLGFPQSIATAMDLLRASCPTPQWGHGRFASMFKITPGDFVNPAQRSTVSILRQHLGYWCNMQVNRAKMRSLSSIYGDF